MSKPYKEMSIEELKLEKMRLQYEINNSKGNYIRYKQNKKSLDNVITRIALLTFQGQ